MALEQTIADLATAANQLTTEVSGKQAAIDARMLAKENEVDAYVNNARGEQSHFRLSKNQMLTGAGAVPDFWAVGGGTTLARVFTVDTGVIWADRTVEEQALLTAMGRPNVQYLDTSFDVWRMAWSTNATSYTMYQRIPSTVALTVGAMVKLESGLINNYWGEGAVLGAWVNTGIHIKASPASYQMIHPMKKSGAGSLLFALPAAVTGHVPLGANQWGKFPYIGDTYND